MFQRHTASRLTAWSGQKVPAGAHTSWGLTTYVHSSFVDFVSELSFDRWQYAHVACVHTLYVPILHLMH